MTRNIALAASFITNGLFLASLWWWHHHDPATWTQAKQTLSLVGGTIAATLSLATLNHALGGVEPKAPYTPSPDNPFANLVHPTRDPRWPAFQARLCRWKRNIALALDEGGGA